MIDIAQAPRSAAPLRRGIVSPPTLGSAVNTTASQQMRSTQPMPRRFFSDPSRPLESSPDLYISGDVETDGPIPGSFSMLSFGLVVVGAFDGNEFIRSPIGQESFYAELQPVSERFEQEALDVNGLDRDRLRREGDDPRIAMKAAAQWTEHVAQGFRPIFVGYPAMFDWMWIYWYFMEFAEHSPFGFSGCVDLKTMIATKARVPVSHARKSELPAHLRAESPHTHHALDDAIEQGEIFANVFDWPGRQ